MSLARARSWVSISCGVACFDSFGIVSSSFLCRVTYLSTRVRKSLMTAALGLTRGACFWGAAPGAEARLIRRAPRIAERRAGSMGRLLARATPSAAVVAELQRAAEIMLP